MSAALIGTNISYIALTFLPPVVWLLFYLREDRRHPEPKYLLILAFAGGIASALLAIAGECAFINILGSSCKEGINTTVSIFYLFLGIALIEEYLKYLAVKLLILRKTAFDEPIDAMIYMMTSALGFAALENALFIFPMFQQNVFSGLEVAANRFLGANLLHALSSGIVGFFLARAWFHPKRHHFVAIGIIIATLLHAAFNYLILVKEALPQGTFYLILLLSIMAVVIFIDFEKLKKMRIENELPHE